MSWLHFEICHVAFVAFVALVKYVIIEVCQVILLNSARDIYHVVSLPNTEICLVSSFDFMR